MERISFEEALQKLEAIVNKLEDGSVSLEESVSLYEEGYETLQTLLRNSGTS